MATKIDELQAENERLRAVLGDQLESKHGAASRPAIATTNESHFSNLEAMKRAKAALDKIAKGEK